MPLLRQGHLSQSNPWVTLADQDELPEDGSPVIVSLARFLELEHDGRQTVSGVALSADDDPLALKPYIDHLQLVCIDFPVFADSHGCSQAQLLRKTLGYSGELRATGDVLPDKILPMLRMGVDAFEFAAEPDSALIEEILSHYQSSYQPAYSLPIAG